MSFLKFHENHYWRIIFLLLFFSLMITILVHGRTRNWRISTDIFSSVTVFTITLMMMKEAALKALIWLKLFSSTCCITCYLYDVFQRANTFCNISDENLVSELYVIAGWNSLCQWSVCQHKRSYCISKQS